MKFLARVKNFTAEISRNTRIDVILKITEIAHILGRSVFPRLGSCIISEKNVLGYHFGQFFSMNSSGHPYHHCG
jgi:hypothetical protein